jgi:uncharacterized membrane protein YidH (DUF202 family)
MMCAPSLPRSSTSSSTSRTASARSAGTRLDRFQHRLRETDPATGHSVNDYRERVQHISWPVTIVGIVVVVIGIVTIVFCRKIATMTLSAARGATSKPHPSTPLGAATMGAIVLVVGVAAIVRGIYFS